MSECIKNPHPATIAADAVTSRQRVKNPRPAKVVQPTRGRVKANEPAGSLEASAAPATRPTNKATKAEWIAYVNEGLGADLNPDEWTKAQLIEHFGN